MSEIGTVKNVDNGMYIAGAGIYLSEEFAIGGINNFV